MRRFKLMHFIIVLMFVFWGCDTSTTEENKPANPSDTTSSLNTTSAAIEVNGQVNIGPYVILPPSGYWYFENEFPEKLNQDDMFLLTFFHNKNAIPKTPVIGKVDVAFNVGLSLSIYNNYSAYYEGARKAKVEYLQLPVEANLLSDQREWSCKYLNEFFHTLECISIREYLVTIAASGTEKKEVLLAAKELKRIINSLERKK